MVGGNDGKEVLFQIPSEIKYSSMFEDDPEVWFEGLETQFAIRMITKPETKLESGLAMVDNIREESRLWPNIHPKNHRNS